MLLTMLLTMLLSMLLTMLLSMLVTMLLSMLLTMLLSIFYCEAIMFSDVIFFVDLVMASYSTTGHKPSTSVSIIIV
jgi:hypothetical protein